MTRQVDEPTHLYVPSLLRERVPCRLPENVLFLDPGLTQTADDSGLFRPHSYPFSRERAARVLDELLAVGKSLDIAGTTGKSAARSPIGTRDVLTDDEKNALARFSGIDGGTNEPTADPRIAAHKLVLLSWDLERRLVEITALRRQVLDAIRPLNESLHGPLPDDELLHETARAMPGTLPESLADLPDAVEPDWRLTLAAMAVFLPASAILVTAHEPMRDALEDADLLRPLGKNPPTGNWPEETPARLLRARAPLWRVLGRTREPGSMPWLCTDFEILVFTSEGQRQ